MYKKENLIEVADNIALKDFKDWLFPISVFRENVEVDDLLKWIRYKAVNYEDADSVLKIDDKNGSIVEKLGWYDKSVPKRKRYIDCIFSLTISFNAFLRMYLKSIPCYGELMDSYNQIFSNEAKSEFAHNYNIKQHDVDKLFKQLNRIAKNTHTLGNYMPCPDGTYNSAKGYKKGYKYFQDRFELLYKELIEGQHTDHIDDTTRDNWKKWIEANEEKLCLLNLLHNDDLLKFRYKVRKGRGLIYYLEDKNDVISYTEYLSLANDIIEERGKKFEVKLKS